MLDANEIQIASLPMLPLAERANLPDCHAVYFAIAANGKVLYIGRAFSLLRRWRRHHREYQLEQLGNVRIAWLTASDVADLGLIERRLIQRFGPPLNNSLVIRGGSKHVYLLVPPVLHDWLRTEAEVGGFKNVQDKILDVLRTARESRQEQVA